MARQNGSLVYEAYDDGDVGGVAGMVCDFLWEF